MPFPITANGTTYNLVDFQGTKYARNLGPFLADLMIDGYNYQKATSNTSNSSALGSKSFTVVEATVSFVIGQEVLVAAQVDPLNWMLGTVTGWNAGTKVVTLSVNTSATGSTLAAWNLYTGQRGTAPSGTLTLVQGGTASTTAAPARDFMGLMQPTQSAAPQFLDFIGYKRLMNNQAYTTSPTGYATALVNGGTINAEYHKLDKAYSVLPDMANHPGVAELMVRNGGDVAAFALSDYGQYSFGYHELCKLCFGIFIPDYTKTASLSTSEADTVSDDFTDQWVFRIGWLKNWRINASGSFAACMANMTTIDEFGVTIGNSQNQKNPNIWYAESSLSAVSYSGWISTSTIPLGRWLTVTLETDDSNTVTISIKDEAGNVLESQGFVQSSSDTDANAGIPFIRVYKNTGNKARAVYVDYVYVEMPQMLSR